MYTNKEQTERLIDSGIDPNSADMMVVAGRTKDPFKDWNPIPKTVENCKKYEGKDSMPVWSDEALFNILPSEIISPNQKLQNKETGEEMPLKYELIIKKAVIPGRGKFSFAGYPDPTGGPIHSGFLSTSLTNILVDLVIDIMCTREKDFANYVW